MMPSVPTRALMHFFLLFRVSNHNDFSCCMLGLFFSLHPISCCRFFFAIHANVSRVNCSWVDSVEQDANAATGPLTGAFSN
jgi:hypothetical protein